MNSSDQPWAGLRIGQGVDVHAYSDQVGRPCRLAGLDWAGERAFAGTSDADVAIHACLDAVLSAANLGDLGSVFGVDDPAWQDGSGEAMVEYARQLWGQKGVQIVNLAVQFVGQRPRIGDRRAEASQRLSDLFGAPVSFLATTTDHLGFLGRGEGGMAIASALLWIPPGQ